MPTAALIASAGPKERKKDRWAAMSAAVPIETVRPAAATTWPTSATAARAASTRSSPARRRLRALNRKKIE